MVTRITQLDETPVDVFEAVKRALIKRGFVRRRGVSAADEEIVPANTKSNPENDISSEITTETKKPASNKKTEKSYVSASGNEVGGKSKPHSPTAAKQKKYKETAEEKKDDMDDEGPDKASEALTFQDVKTMQQHPYETGEVESQEIHEKLIDITEKAQDVLFKADTVFPFTLFPDTITVDREKITVATRYFFRTAKIVTVPLSSILNAEIDVGPFFATLHISSKYFVQEKYTIHYLSRKQAMELHHLLHGYLLAHEKDIDITDIEKEDLLVLLGDLGQGVKE